MVTPLHHGCDHHLNNHYGRYTKEKKRKIVQRWSPPSITAVTTTWTTITAVTPRKREGNSIQERSRPSITPVTMVLTTITVVIKAVTTSRSFFFFLSFLPMFSPRPWPIFKAWSRPWSLPYFLLSCVFVFQMLLMIVISYNYPNISIYACIYIVQRSFTNYKYFEWVRWEFSYQCFV